MSLLRQAMYKNLLALRILKVVSDCILPILVNCLHIISLIVGF